jgi:hypothetical protein
LSSAALAASLAVAVTLALQPPRGERLAAQPPEVSLPEASLAVQATAEPPTAGAAPTSSAADYLAVINRADGRNAATPLLALYERSSKQASSRSTATSVAGDATPPAAKSAHELRQELLPTPRPSAKFRSGAALVWPWPIQSSGESI